MANLKSFILSGLVFAVGVAQISFALAYGSADSTTKQESNQASYKIAGWDESLVSVVSFDGYHEFFVELAEWELRSQGQVSREQLDAWKIPATATAQYRLYANKGAQTGFIRLVKFDGVEQRYIRQDSQSWDTGGIFDLNIRVKNLDLAALRIRRLGWVSRAPITRFVFGDYDVREWIVSSPDGLAFAMIDRISPTLEGWPNFKSMSRVFNSTLVVKDFDKSFKFYNELLGFEVKIMEHGYLSKKPGPNSLGFPYNLQTVNPRKVTVMNLPGYADQGTIEVLKILGIDGADHQEHANLPNIGIAMLSFSVVNIDALRNHFENKQVEWVHSLRTVEGVKRMIIHAPEGGWLEFYEAF